MCGGCLFLWSCFFPDFVCTRLWRQCRDIPTPTNPRTKSAPVSAPFPPTAYGEVQGRRKRVAPMCAHSGRQQQPPCKQQRTGKGRTAQTGNGVDKGGVARLDRPAPRAERGDRDAGRQQPCERGVLRVQARAVCRRPRVRARACRVAPRVCAPRRARQRLAQRGRVELHDVAPACAPCRAHDDQQRPEQQQQRQQCVSHSSHQRPSNKRRDDVTPF